MHNLGGTTEAIYIFYVPVQNICLHVSPGMLVLEKSQACIARHYFSLEFQYFSPQNES